MRLLAFFLVLLFGTAPIALKAQSIDSREDRFIFMTQAPKIVGKLRESKERVDPTNDMTFAKDVYQLETETHHIVTHVSKAFCGSVVEDARSSFYLMAIQYLPRVPRSFLEATRHDYFKEVYVRDENDRLRLYENVTGHQMLELTSRFRPACASI